MGTINLVHTCVHLYILGTRVPCMCALVCGLLRAIRSVPALVHDKFLGIKHKLTSQEAVGYTVLSTGQPKSAGFSKNMHIRIGRASQIQVPAKCQGLKGSELIYGSI